MKIILVAAVLAFHSAPPKVQGAVAEDVCQGNELRSLLSSSDKSKYDTVVAKWSNAYMHTNGKAAKKRLVVDYCTRVYGG